MGKRWRCIITVLLSLDLLLLLINVQYTTNDNIYFLKMTENDTNFYPGVELKDTLLRDHSAALRKEILEISENPEELTTNSSSLSLMTILLLSSVGRSGSSFMGELLASQHHNIYMYEPIRALPREDQRLEGEVQAELLKNFQCQIRSSFLNYGPKPQISVRHPYTQSKNKKDVSPAKLKMLCEQEPIRIIKTIRTRLSWTRKLLEDKSLNMKVIHLVRDPRGSYNSFLDLEWKMTSQEMCQRIAADLELRHEIERDFPGRYFFIKYEDFCLHPYEKTSDIFKFLKGEDIASSKNMKSENISSTEKLKREFSPDIPERVFNYLKSHTHVNLFSERSPWTTVRETSSIYQKWRHKITQYELSVVEANCQKIITILGHRTFESIQNAKNMSISLFL